MSYKTIIFISIFILFFSCKKDVIEVIENNLVAENIQGKWKAISFLKDDEFLELDDKISFNITFSNVQKNKGDYTLVSVTPNFTGQEVEYLEDVLVSEFSIKDEGTVLSVLNSNDYNLSFKDGNLVLYVDNTNNLSLVYERD